MNQQNSRPGQQGGFDRPEFTPGPGGEQTPPRLSQQPGVDQHIATPRGVRAEIAENDDAQLQERQKNNSRRRQRVYGAVIAAVVVIAVIVALMIWLWTVGFFLPDAN